MITHKYGCWTVNNIKFDRKIDAVHYSSKHNLPVSYYYHDDLWEAYNATINRNLLGKQNLNDMYRDRAQQLRDSYQYLVLYYSGGTDSHNILRTFIDNDIKLDEICVKWPKSFIDSNLYVVNNLDRRPQNYWSEWDYAIKPIIEYLKQHRPDIKITISDYTENFSTSKLENIMMSPYAQHYRNACLLYSSALSPTTDSKRNVGHIYGIDKPILSVFENKIHMIFTDVCTTVAFAPENDPESMEYFYWSPDFPQLPIEMAYQMAEHYVTNVSDRKYLWTHENRYDTRIGDFQHDLGVKICYTTWDYRFQTSKARADTNSNDKWYWFTTHPEFSQAYDCVAQNYRSLLTNVSEQNLVFGKDRIPALKTYYTRGFYIRDL